MATTKKPAAKKPAAKKPAAKKPAAKKPAAKKPAAKKPAAKKPAAKKPAAKKPAAKKPAAKTAAKKPAAKKPAAKTAAKKPAAKTAAKKPAAKSPAKKAAPASGSLKVMDLFEAYAQEKLPRDHGYIISAFFSENSAYSRYEIISYSGVKEIHYTGTGLTFVTGGKKLYVLVEPATYPLKYQEPVSRREDERIEKRFSELDLVIAKNQSKIYIAKVPNETYGSFTVLKPTGDNFARVVYNVEGVYQIFHDLFEKSFNQEAGIPQADAKTAAAKLTVTVEHTMSFKGEFAP